MKEMVYTENVNVSVLDDDIHNGYHYVILSLGTHPCGYVEIPKSHPYFGKDYDECYAIDCHGGLTYSSSYLRMGEGKQLDGWFIGWDYGHWGDYYGSADFMNSGHKWTTEEIRQECFNVIEQLINCDIK